MRRLAVLAGALALAGCGSDTPPPTVDPATAFPSPVAGFVLTGAPQGGGAGIVAGYQLTGSEAQTAVIATVHRSPPGQTGGGLLPILDIGGGDDPDTVARGRIDRSVLEVRRFYPQAQPGPLRAAYLVQQGRLQNGWQTTLRFTDSFAGATQPIDLDIVVLCCTTDGASYEYRFRHAADVAAGAAEAAFMAALPWAVPTAAGAAQAASDKEPGAGWAQ